MPGPPPQPHTRRRNSHAGFTVLPAVGRRAPRLPGRPDQAIRDAWAAWWGSPMASQWTDGDVPSLLVMAASYGRALTGNARAANEFRQLADRFGLSPLGRLRNRWTLEEEEAEGAQQADATVVRLHPAGGGPPETSA